MRPERNSYWWLKYTDTQLTMLEDVAEAFPEPVRYKGTAERSVRALEKDGLVSSSLDIQLDALHKSRSRRIWIVKATDKLMALERSRLDRNHAH